MSVILERLYYFCRTRERSKNLAEKISFLLENKKNDEALRLCEKEKSSLGDFLRVGIKVNESVEDEKRKVLRRAGARKLEESGKRLKTVICDW